MSGFPATFRLSSLNGTNGFMLQGDADNDYSGWSVSSAGDVNGDGFDDIIIGARRADPNGGASGASYVVFGKASGFFDFELLGSLDGADGFKLSGESEFDNSGFSVSSAGDINGDGLADMIIGAPGAASGVQANGASYVVFGKASGFAANLDLSALDGTNGFKLTGAAAFDTSGQSVSSAGDINGDGFADLIIGAIYASTNGYANFDGRFSGASFVVFGKASGFGADINLSTLDGTNGFKLTGAAAFDKTGSSVSSAGDVNGDGFDDVIIGADHAGPNGQYSGASYVVFGMTSGFAANIDLSSLDGTNGFKLSGVAAGDKSGRSVSSAGDINGDGFADVIVGAPLAGPQFTPGPNGTQSGASYVIFGKASGFAANIELSSLDGTNGFKLTGAAAYDYSGQSVSSAGDFNGDGFDDIIIGADGADPRGFESGSSYLVFGKASGFAANLDLSSLDGSNGFRLDGKSGADQSGQSVSSAGDVNGDGFADIIIGAPYAGSSLVGESYVIFGQRAQTAVTIIGTDQGLTHNGGLGQDVILGRGGNDTLNGWESNDKLNGGRGADIIIGGSGRDLLTGGDGKDNFEYHRLDDSGARSAKRDTIIDFAVNPSASNGFFDRIDISDIDARKGSAGNNAFVFIDQAEFTAEGQIRAVQDGANTLVEFNTRGADAAEMAIVLRNFAATDLTAVDFIL